MNKQEAIDKFFESYLPIKKKNGLLMKLKRKINTETELEIYKYEGGEKKRVLKISGDDEVFIFSKAREGIINYAKENRT